MKPIAGLCIIILLTVQTNAQPPRQEKKDSVVPISCDFIRWDDALYVQKVWREIDLREKINQSFRCDMVDENGSQLFINILLGAVMNGGVQAFADDRFSDSISKAQITDLLYGQQADIDPVYDPNDINKIDSFVVTRPEFDPKSVTKLRVMEQWIFDRESSRLVVRILGIAPLKTLYLPDGRERGTSVMFWVYYPDLRPMLVNASVYNPKNMGNGRMTWDELFQSRMFSSYIIKSTIENASNKNIRAYIRDPKLALLEGENIRGKIFNYEQDQWSY